MRHLVLVAVLFSVSALAGDLEVPLNGRASLGNRHPAVEVSVRDPSLVQVVVTDGAVSLEGKQSGVTSLNVTYSDGEVDTVLVVVGKGVNSSGPRMEHSQTLDLKKSDTAQAKAPAAAKPAPKVKQREAVQEASDVVRAAAESL